MSYPFVIDGKEAGTLEETREGSKLILTARCPGRNDGLYRAFALMRKGRQDMGLMVPEGGWLIARRSFSPGEIEGLKRGEGVLQYRFGGAKLTRDETAGPEEEWNVLRSPGSRFSDPLLRRIWSNVQGALIKRTDEELLIAAPYTEDLEQPLAAIFCLGEPAEIGGRQYLVFRLSRLGEQAG
ncbi:MAG: hypothetical protein ACOX7P_08615 [Oscillospiraceae bacterium]|jgi:hypothetical protein